MFGKAILIGSAAVVLGGMSIMGWCEGLPPLPAVHDWAADPLLAAKLQSSETAVGQCALRLPAGWKIVSSETDATGRSTYTLSAVAGDNTAPYIAISTDTPTDDAWTPDGSLNDALRDPLDLLSQVTETPLEPGTVAGRPAMRRYGKGVAAAGSNVTHVFGYVVGDKSLETVAVVVDGAPTSKTDLPLLEASILTLHQLPPAAPPGPSASGATASASAPGDQQWTSDPKYLKDLSPEQTYNGIIMRAPKVGVPDDNSSPSDPSTSGLTWSLRDASLHADLILTIRHAAAGMPTNLDTFVADVVAKSTSSLLNGTHTTPEYSTTPLGRTARFYVEGTSKDDAAAPTKMAVYAFVTPTQMVTFTASDANDPDQRWFHAYEAAILTARLTPDFEASAPTQPAQTANNQQTQPDTDDDDPQDQPLDPQNLTPPPGMSMHDYIMGRHGPGQTDPNGDQSGVSAPEQITDQPEQINGPSDDGSGQ